MREAASDTFFFARQPILNRQREIVAYELLYRGGARHHTAIPLPAHATERVLINAMNLTGLENLLKKGTKAFVNIDERMLLDERVETIPKSHFVLELLETVEFDPEILERIGQLHRAGYTFALDDLICTPERLAAVEPVLPYIRYVKLDIPFQSVGEAASCVARFRSMGIAVLAEKVERREEYDAFAGIGCDLFQGFFFARPRLISGRHVDARAALILRIIQLLDRDDYREALAAFRQDAGLTAQLLRYINSAAFGFKSDIKSIGQALAMLGKRHVKQWLALISYAVGSEGGLHSPLLKLAQERSNIMRLLAQRCCGTKGAEDAAFIGLLSLLDVLFSRPLESLLQELRIDRAIADVLLGRSRDTLLGAVYEITLRIERFDDDAIRRLLPRLQLSFGDFAAVVQEGYRETESFNEALRATAE